MIKIPIEYAENIHKVLEDHVSLGFAIVSRDIKNIVSKEAYDKLVDIMIKYHNANCGPFNRYLKKLIDDEKSSNGRTTENMWLRLKAFAQTLLRKASHILKR